MCEKPMPQDSVVIRGIRNRAGYFAMEVWPDEGEVRPAMPLLSPKMSFVDDNGDTYEIMSAEVKLNSFYKYADPSVGRMQDERYFTYAYEYITLRTKD